MFLVVYMFKAFRFVRHQFMMDPSPGNLNHFQHVDFASHFIFKFTIFDFEFRYSFCLWVFTPCSILNVLCCSFISLIIAWAHYDSRQAFGYDENGDFVPPSWVLQGGWAQTTINHWVKVFKDMADKIFKFVNESSQMKRVRDVTRGRRQRPHWNTT